MVVLDVKNKFIHPTVPAVVDNGRWIALTYSKDAGFAAATLRSFQTISEGKRLAQAPVVKAFTSSSGKDAGACSHWHGRIGCCAPLLALSLWLANTILVC